MKPKVRRVALVVAVLLSSSNALAQAVGGAERAQPVPGDPGISWMVVMDQPQFRVLASLAASW